MPWRPQDGPRPRRTAPRSRRGGGRGPAARPTRQRHTERLGRAGHRVRGVHAAAGALPGQIARSISSTSSRVINPRAQAPTASKASMMVTRVVRRMTRGRAASSRRRGTLRPVEPRGGHQHAWQRLVTAGQQHAAVEPLGLHHDLDRVGDHLAADQRVVHPLVAHRDAVGHRDRAELQGIPARLAYARLGGLGQPVQREVAGRDLVPGRGDTDLRLGEVVVSMPTARSMPGRRRVPCRR